MIKLGIITFTMFMSIGANLSDGFMSRLGFDQDILLVALVAFVAAGLLYHRRLALVSLVVVMTLGANVSEEMARTIGYESDYLLAGLLALAILPLVCRQFDGGVF